MDTTRKKNRVVVLTGAGVSAESGLRTFRDTGGLWEGHDVADVATPEAFLRDPALVHRFYSERRLQLEEVEPNAAHRAISALENQSGVELFLVTQNVDDLHERAGSTRVHHMHGELRKLRCQAAGETSDWSAPSSQDSVCGCCGRPGRLRPHIVWFGEIPLGMDLIYRHLERADLFVSIGTSGNVYPAAGFFEVAKRQGARTVELNLEPSQNAGYFDEGVYGPASEIVPKYFERLAEEPRIDGYTAHESGRS